MLQQLRFGGTWGLPPCSKMCSSAFQIYPEQSSLHVPVEQSMNSPPRRGQLQHGQQARHAPEPAYVEPGSSHPETSHLPIKASNCPQALSPNGPNYSMNKKEQGTQECLVKV